MEGVLESFVEIGVRIRDSTLRVSQPRHLDVRTMLHVGVFYCS